MSNSKYRLILGSGSPRRKQMFDWLGVPFDIIPPDVNEESTIKDPIAFAREITERKVQAVQDHIQQSNADSQQSFIVLCADTIVVHNNEILGKPTDIGDARKTLLRLRDEGHKVITSVSLMKFGNVQSELMSFHEETNVKFWNFTDSVLEDYLALGDSMDKAGSYGLQSPGMILVEKIEGSYSNVIGLPLDRVIKNIVKLTNNTESGWRESFC